MAIIKDLSIFSQMYKNQERVSYLCAAKMEQCDRYLFHYRVLLQDGKGGYRLLLSDFAHLSKNVHVAVHACLCVLVCSSCCEKRPQTGCLKPQTLVSHGSEDWKAMIKVLVNSTSGGALFLPCRQLPSHCVLTWSFLVAVAGEIVLWCPLLCLPGHCCC